MAVHFAIHELTQHDGDWEQYVDVISGEDQVQWAFNETDERSSRHFVMAKQDGCICRAPSNVAMTAGFG